MAWNRTLIVGLTTALAYTSVQLWVTRAELNTVTAEAAGDPEPRNLDYEIEAALARRASTTLERTVPSKSDDIFVEVAARMRPSVVSISVRTHADSKSALEREGEGAREHPGVREDRDLVSGSGMVLDSDGHILTNLHVIQGARTTQVTLCSGERYDAQLVGVDHSTDLAVLRIDTRGEELVPVTWVDTAALPRVGERVLAIGNAYGLGWTVTQGIVSSLHRTAERESQANYTDYIQTDAAVNPGNSGGPLVNMKGEVVGVNSVIVSDHGESTGIGLAMPAADASFVAHELIRARRVVRGCLGLRARALADVDARERLRLGVTTARGALVTNVRPRGPAHDAGLRRGDVILELGDRPIPSFSALRSLIARTPPGESVSLTVVRDRSLILIDVEVGSLDQLRLRDRST